MKQTLCDACTQPIWTDKGYVQVSWETDDVLVRVGFEDQSDKQFHDWQCLASFAADVELMRKKQEELRNQSQVKPPDVEAHGFIGKREWGILPSPDKRCLRCGIARKDHK